MKLTDHARPWPILLVLLLVLAHGAGAQAIPDTTTPVVFKTMGQPQHWKPYFGAFLGINNLTTTDMATNVGGLGLVGIYHDLINPLVGVGVAAEGYGGYIGEEVDGGVRLDLALPVIFLQGGVDYSFGDGTLAFILSFAMPIRRGGIFGHGSLARIDWLPSRGQTINVGLQVPMLQPWVGKTRPKAQDITIPRAPHAQFERADSVAKADTTELAAAALAQMRREALWTIDLINVFYTGLGKSYDAGLTTQRDTIASYVRAASRTDALHPKGWSPTHEIALWHAQMKVAFAVAAGTFHPTTSAGGQQSTGSSSGVELARAARRALLDSVLIPYDARFGQYKDPNQIMGFGTRGRLAFEAWVAVSDVPPDRRDEVLAVFDGILGIMEQCRRELYRINGTDSRLNWMPMQFALEAEDHDDQEELDELIARVVDRPFTDGNAAVFMLGQQFQVELANQIASARNYQVLWIHDYRGVTATMMPDSIGAFQTGNYLRALLRGVERYDSLGKMPTFFIFNDQNYYIAGKSQLWMDLLQDPLRHKLKLPAADSAMQRKFVALQDSLRVAVAASNRLQELAKAQGKGFVEKLVRVNISITQPSDLSYRSTRIIGVLPIVSDNLVRDHRKITFFDLSEDDPAVGRAAYTGVGVAEGYADPTWDDRVLVVAGPAILALKTDAERLLIRNGFTADEIPAPLRPQALSPDYDDKVAALVADGYSARGVQVHNDVGFGWKRASIVEMMLITLMPPGSLIFIPDSLWTSLTYASHLVVAALRGCQVYLIAPSFKNAPSAAPITMTRNMDIFGRLLEVQIHLATEMQKDGGGLRVGIYTRTSPVNNAEARYAEVAKTFDAHPWLQELFLFNDSLMTLLNGAAARLKASGYVPQRVIEDDLDRRPRLHAKTQLFATRATLQAISRLPDYEQFMREQFRSTLEVLHTPDNMGMPGEKRAENSMALERAFSKLTPAQRDSAILFLTVGSQNKDTRGLFLDGETNFVISGSWALQAYTEMFYFFGVTTWVETQQDFNALFPSYSERQRKLGYRLRKAI